MKSGRSIQDVSREILRQQKAKADYHAVLPPSIPAAVPHASAYGPLCDDMPQTAAAVLRDAISFVFSFGYRLS